MYEGVYSVQETAGKARKARQTGGQRRMIELDQINIQDERTKAPGSISADDGRSNYTEGTREREEKRKRKEREEPRTGSGVFQTA